MNAVLKIQYLDGRVEERSLPQGAYEIGRDSGQIVLPDPNVSARHARLEVQGARVTLIELGSTNGSYDAAGNRISAQWELRPHEPVRLGGTWLTLLSSAPVAGGTAVMPQFSAPPPPPTGHGAPSAGYGPPPAGSGYGAPPAGYGAPPAGYGAPPAGYGAPPPPAQQGGFHLPFSAPTALPGAPQLDYALWGTRVAGYAIDMLFVLVVMGVLYAVAGGLMTGVAAVSNGNEAASGAASGMCCLLLVLFPAASLAVGLINRTYLVAKRGSSIGQGVMKLKVVDANGQLITMGTAAVRLVAMLVLSMVPFGQLLDLLWPLFDPQRQTLHDKAVNTFVINDRGRG